MAAVKVLIKDANTYPLSPSGETLYPKVGDVVEVDGDANAKLIEKGRVELQAKPARKAVK